MHGIEVKFDLKLGVVGLGCWAFGGGHYWVNNAEDVNEYQAAVIWA